MLACVDVDYRTDSAVAACVVFDGWEATAPVAEHVAVINQVAPYVPGEFYRRELPCLLEVLGRVGEPLDVVIVDGYVWLDAAGRAGLGARLHEALADRRPNPPAVIGVAKTRFEGAPAEEVVRGTSRAPLFVTAVGVDAHEAAERVRRMHGVNRMPRMLKRVDQLCRA